MYRRLYRVLFGIFTAVGLGIGLTGVILYFILGTKAGELTSSNGQPSGLYVNLFLLLLLGGIGLVFLLIGVIGLLVAAEKQKKEQYLRENGRAIYAKILKSEQNYAIMINRRHPYQVVAQYVDERTKTIYNYRSEYIREDPGVPSPTIDTVRVFVNPENMKQYYMDLSSIRELNGYKVENF